MDDLIECPDCDLTSEQGERGIFSVFVCVVFLVSVFDKWKTPKM